MRKQLRESLENFDTWVLTFHREDAENKAEYRKQFFDVAIFAEEDLQSQSASDEGMKMPYQRWHL